MRDDCTTANLTASSLPDPDSVSCDLKLDFGVWKQPEPLADLLRYGHLPLRCDAHKSLLVRIIPLLLLLSQPRSGSSGPTSLGESETDPLPPGAPLVLYRVLVGGSLHAGNVLRVGKNVSVPGSIYISY